MALVLPLTLLVGLACLLLLASPHPYLAPLVIPGLAGLILLYRQPAWGLLILFAMVPLEGLVAGSPGITASKLLGAAMIAILVLQLLLKQLPPARLRSNLWPLLLGFIVCYLLSFACTDSLEWSLRDLRYLSVGLAIFLLTLAFSRDLDLMLLAKVVTLSVAASCVPTLLSDARQVDARAVGLLADPNYFALLLCIAFPLGLMLLLRAPRWPHRLLWLLPQGLLLAGLMRSGSRSGLLVLLLILALAAWHYRADIRRLLPRHFGWLILALAVAVPLAPALLPDSFVQRLEALTSLKAGARGHVDPSLSRRTAYLMVGAGIIQENPLLGSGPGTFPVHYGRTGYSPAFADLPVPEELLREAHNTYLGMLSEIGLPGGLLFIGLVVLSLRNFQYARRHWLSRGDPQRTALATHLGLACVALACFLAFLSIPSHKYLWAMFALSSWVRLQAREDKDDLPSEVRP
jgi:O-antigen ligase